MSDWVPHHKRPIFDSAVDLIRNAREREVACAHDATWRVLRVEATKDYCPEFYASDPTNAGQRAFVRKVKRRKYGFGYGVRVTAYRVVSNHIKAIATCPTLLIFKSKDEAIAAAEKFAAAA